MDTKKRITTDHGRFYEIDENVFWPSVTTILEARPLAFGLKEFFLTNTKDEAERKLKEAGLQGSKIHHSIDLLLHGATLRPSGITKIQLDMTNLVNDPEYGEPELLDYLQRPFTKTEDKMMRGFMQFWADFEPEVIQNEVIVAKSLGKKKGYAGTVDFVGYIKMYKKAKKAPQNAKSMTEECSRELVVLDWKTGKGLYKEYDLQVSAYMHAYNEKSGKRKRRAKHCGLLQLGVNKCGYKLHMVEHPRKDFQRFKDTAKIWFDLNEDAKPSMYEFANEYKIERPKKAN